MFLRKYRWLFLLIAGYVFFTLLAIFHLPDVKILKTHYPTLRVQEKSEDVVVTFSKSRPRDWVRLGSLPAYVAGAVIVSEDWSFYQHHGIDWNELRAAVSESFATLEKPRGASTLTQQLAKNVFLQRKRSYIRKLREALIATEIEKQFPKQKILETYLNVVEFGPNVFGINNGAQYFFDKEASALLPEEAAFLAMILPNPKELSVSFRKKQLTPYAKSRVTQILGKMRKAGYLDDRGIAQATPGRLFIPPIEPIEPEAIEPESTPEPFFELDEGSQGELE